MGGEEALGEILPWEERGHWEKLCHESRVGTGRNYDMVVFRRETGRIKAI